ncbi:MAG: SAM-dependent methyltransferase [Pirellulaceae bacterium]
MMTPPSVQEALPATERIGQEEYVFAVCQQGAEASIKSHCLDKRGGLRLAFSRPGLLTFKADSSSLPPRDWQIRQSGYAFGTVQGDQAEDLVTAALALAGNNWPFIHIYQRDPGLPGVRGFEPGPTELTQAVGEAFADQLQGTAASIGGICPIGSRVMDVILVEPNRWLIGHHLATRRHECWPGGVFHVPAPPEMISRAYLKMAEAVAWSGLDLQPGDQIAEIGSAPGGACQRLLDIGLRVTGIDFAEMAPLLIEHDRFRHWRSKSSAVKRRLFAGMRWLAADANVTPKYTLDAVEDIVTYPTSGFEGLLLTFKLTNYELADEMPLFTQRIRGWGFERVEVRQLAYNRRECCVVAERPSSWKPPSRAASMQRSAQVNARRRVRKARKRAP